MTATVAFQLRIPAHLAEALNRLYPRGDKTRYINGLIERDLQRRGELPAPPKRKGAK